jgi:hypothetical protein
MPAGRELPHRNTVPDRNTVPGTFLRFRPAVAPAAPSDRNTVPGTFLRFRPAVAPTRALRARVPAPKAPAGATAGRNRRKVPGTVFRSEAPAGATAGRNRRKVPGTVFRSGTVFRPPACRCTRVKKLSPRFISEIHITHVSIPTEYMSTNEPSSSVRRWTRVRRPLATAKREKRGVGAWRRSTCLRRPSSAGLGGWNGLALEVGVPEAWVIARSWIGTRGPEGRGFPVEPNPAGARIGTRHLRQGPRGASWHRPRAAA